MSRGSQLLPWTRRRLVVGLTAAVVAGVSRSRTAAAGTARGVVVPIGLQAKLLAKVATFDRNMHRRASGSVRVLVLQRDGDAESLRTANHLERSLRELGSIASMPVVVHGATFTNPGQLAARCRAGGVAIVYLTPGLEGELGGIGAALEGISVLSVSSVPDHVYRGTVLAFDLIEGKPKILVHLGRARGQMVDFKASFLRLAKVVDA